MSARQPADPIALSGLEPTVGPPGVSAAAGLFGHHRWRLVWPACKVRRLCRSNRTIRQHQQAGRHHCRHRRPPTAAAHSPAEQWPRQQPSRCCSGARWAPGPCPPQQSSCGSQGSSTAALIRWGRRRRFDMSVVLQACLPKLAAAAAGVNLAPAACCPALPALALPLHDDLLCTPMQVLDVEFSTGDKFSLPAEYLRAESPAAEARDRAGRPKVGARVWQGREGETVCGCSPAATPACRRAVDRRAAASEARHGPVQPCCRATRHCRWWAGGGMWAS